MAASNAITLFHAEPGETAWIRARAASVRDTQTLADQTPVCPARPSLETSSVKAKREEKSISPVLAADDQRNILLQLLIFSAWLWRLYDFRRRAANLRERRAEVISAVQAARRLSTPPTPHQLEITMARRSSPCRRRRTGRGAACRWRR